jgi:hypothetical protein
MSLIRFALLGVLTGVLNGYSSSTDNETNP